MAQDRNPMSLWFPWLNFSPDTNTTTITDTFIGCNIEEGDGPIERHVLESVGSYGFQLNRVLDALRVMVNQAQKEGKLTESKLGKDYKKIQACMELAGKADQAAIDFERQTAESNVGKAIQGMQALCKSDSISDRELYKKLKEQLGKEIFGKESSGKEAARVTPIGV